jgi:hypothetical protein
MDNMDDNNSINIAGVPIENVQPVTHTQLGAPSLNNRQLAILASVVNRELGFDRVAALQSHYPNDAAAILPVLQSYIAENG